MVDTNTKTSRTFNDVAAQVNLLMRFSPLSPLNEVCRPPFTISKPQILSNDENSKTTLESDSRGAAATTAKATIDVGEGSNAAHSQRPRNFRFNPNRRHIVASH
jgi:hypothetical protein